MEDAAPEDATLDDVKAWDAVDPLRDFRSKFELPAGVIYLDGNSLGPLPRANFERQERLLRQEWGRGLIASWQSYDWLGAPARIGDKIARLIGARPGEVIVADSTSVNLFKLLVVAVKLRPGRHTILLETADFPTDRYMADGVAALLPDLRVRTATADELTGAIDVDVAVVLLAHVHYRTGAAHDMAAVTRMAHAAGALILWDLSHSVGAVAVDLSAHDVDLAVGCGYKFLNGGPGAPAFLYVRESLQAASRSPLQGWMGHADPFAFDAAYRPATGMARFLCGTPPMLSMVALETGVDLCLAADPRQVYSKSARLFSLFAARVAARCGDGHDLALVTPMDPLRRGSQISIRHSDAAVIMTRLIAAGVIGDFRPPDILRFGLTPLATSYEDIWRAVDALRTVSDVSA